MSENLLEKIVKNKIEEDQPIFSKKGQKDDISSGKALSGKKVSEAKPVEKNSVRIENI